eukprot:gnl/MRDRNA2_/MRDRNA2_81519_c0_seq2.p1 gnl/MRDRNA2_/MRDRNA2_81519_c0~~gnl/MRDRNA2_/MRDRNA2_81519_c0_seq2.p1  ORF type:complete len:113 (+),score=1.85 gnl/MRDRNA2_/MRDRNA2_81519_c0_seq2:180-518(+)
MQKQQEMALSITFFVVAVVLGAHRFRSVIPVPHDRHTALCPIGFPAVLIFDAVTYLRGAASVLPVHQNLFLVCGLLRCLRLGFDFLEIPLVTRKVLSNAPVIQRKKLRLFRS